MALAEVSAAQSCFRFEADMLAPLGASCSLNGWRALWRAAERPALFPVSSGTCPLHLQDAIPDCKVLGHVSIE